MGSFVKLVTKLEKNDVGTKFVPLIRRLANGDWFTTRVSACGLFSSTYPLVDENLQEELRSLYRNLCDDDTPMVRKAAYQNLGKLCLAVPKAHFKSDIYQILKGLSQDDLDSMRIYTLECSTQLVSEKKLDPKEFMEYLFPLITAMQDDQSWRVRKVLAEDMAKFSENLPDAIFSKSLLPLYAKLLRDKEAEVRTAAAADLHKVCTPLKTGLQDFIVPVLDLLAADQKENVRIAFSQSLVHLCIPFGNIPPFAKDTAQKLLVPIIQQLAKDEHPNVRNNIINDLEILSKAIGPNGLINGLLPSLIELSKDPKWRVRYAIVSKSSMLANDLGVKIFEKKLQNLVTSSLTDHVFAIREECCLQIGQIVKLFGGKWAVEKFFPTAFAIYDKTANYLHRMTCLLLITKVVEVGNCESEIIDKHLIPLIQNAVKDDVPNVRIAAAKTMDILIDSGKLDKKVIKDKVIPGLQKLSDDTDVDVIFFSRQALAKCE
eukprot:TRINITY_DN806_c0_g1_i1.p1 TRINITY_DN806_c0_g1~~TRINITY_DN806_c0_g1_i1.p1  ORF type:complete len:488 (-),score=89.43 TRINITY_DN806_c0_g1_i1:333-1796(-)